MRPVLVVTPGQRVPYDVGHSLDELSAGVAVSFVELQRVHAALDDRVELRVQRLDDVQLDVGQPQRHLIQVQVGVGRRHGGARRQHFGVGGSGGGGDGGGCRSNASHRVLDGAGHQRQQQQVRFFFVQLLAEHGHRGGYVADWEQLGVLLEHLQGRHDTIVGRYPLHGAPAALRPPLQLLLCTGDCVNTRNIHPRSAATRLQCDDR